MVNWGLLNIPPLADYCAQSSVWVDVFIAICSAVGYPGLISPAGMKPAFIFLAIPLISWILMSIVSTVAISQARKKSFLK